MLRSSLYIPLYNDIYIYTIVPVRSSSCLVLLRALWDATGLRGCCAFETTAIYRSATTLCSKALLEHASGATLRSKSVFELASKPLRARRHCSSLLRSHCALEGTVQASSEAMLRSKARACFEVTARSKLLFEVTRLCNAVRTPTCRSSACKVHGMHGITRVPTYVHTYIHSYIHKYMHTFLPIYLHAYK